MKRYESSLGPSFDTNTISAVITRTNSGDSTCEYKVTASGYDASSSGTAVVVKYGASSLEAKKTFYFKKQNIWFGVSNMGNASGEINNITVINGDRYELTNNAINFGLNSFCNMYFISFYADKDTTKDLIFHNLRVKLINIIGGYEYDNVYSVNVSSNENNLDYSGTCSVDFSSNGYLYIQIDSTKWDSNCLWYSNRRVYFRITADEFPNGYLDIDCYYA